MTSLMSLPHPPCWNSDDQYVDSLLAFVTGSDIFRNLCGGVHILDFLTREPDLYSSVLPKAWRDWLDPVGIHDVLHLLLRADLERVRNNRPTSTGAEASSAPPESLLTYVQSIRHHCLVRAFNPPTKETPCMPRHISVGMKPKKIHEVSNFAAYVDRLAARVSSKIEEPGSLVDFGSGQNYLGRTLASPPYQKHVIAVERKHHNVKGARDMDVHAKLAKKEMIMRNKKEYKRRMDLALADGLPTPPPEELNLDVDVPQPTSLRNCQEEVVSAENGSMTYIEHDIQDGHLQHLLSANTSRQSQPLPKVMTISLHSCGNLSHHALRSLPLNPSVAAVAIIGCCYNLLTERLGPATYKHPQLLRSNHPRLYSTSNSYDPHGFPMSRRLAEFPLPNDAGTGVRLNITARMMAVQAPQNWGHDDSEMFFTRHFYRALLQRILLDLGVVKTAANAEDVADGSSLSGKDDAGTPLIVGSLKKSCFISFKAYVRAALEKLIADPLEGSVIAEKTKTLTDDLIAKYEKDWAFARKQLAVIWSLMAFSAGVVESVIAVDRWSFLKEQECVENAWVEAVFDYKESPRNLCVVGIKKADYVGPSESTRDKRSLNE